VLGQRGDGELLRDVENLALRLHGLPDQTKAQARADAFDYIERFYNPFRKHSTSNYLSPVQFEERQSLKG
jgi:transposase InsO family protein